MKKQILDNHILAISVGLVYLWFGVLKFFPAMSPAESLATNTINFLTFGLIPANISIILLAIMETIIGLFLIMNISRRYAIITALIHMTFTFTPLFLFSRQSFTSPPFAFTLLGQYIFKNIIIVSALITLYKQPTTQNKRP